MFDVILKLFSGHGELCKGVDDEEDGAGKKRGV